MVCCRVKHQTRLYRPASNTLSHPHPPHSSLNVTHILYARLRAKDVTDAIVGYGFSYMKGLRQRLPDYVLVDVQRSRDERSMYLAFLAYVSRFGLGSLLFAPLSEMTVKKPSTTMHPFPIPGQMYGKVCGSKYPVINLVQHGLASHVSGHLHPIYSSVPY